jgi:hypothetical protein
MSIIMIQVLASASQLCLCLEAHMLLLRVICHREAYVSFVCIRYIGVVSVYIQYNCVYCCDTYLCQQVDQKLLVLLATHFLHLICIEYIGVV